MEHNSDDLEQNYPNGMDHSERKAKKKKKKRKRPRDSTEDEHHILEEKVPKLESHDESAEAEVSDVMGDEITVKTEDDPETETSPKKKPKKKRNIVHGFIPPDISKLGEEFVSKHGEEDDIHEKAKGYLSLEHRNIMQENWKKFFEAHPFDGDRTTLLCPYKFDEEAKEAVETFIEEHQFYKHLVRGIDDHPRKIYRTAVRFHPYRKNPVRSAPRKQRIKKEINRNWTEEEKEMLRDAVTEAMSGEKPSDKIPMGKIAQNMPNKNARQCAAQWFNNIRWQLTHKWGVREEPFTSEDRSKLLSAIRQQEVTDAGDIDWKALAKDFPGSNRKDLKLYWKYMTEKIRATMNLQEIVNQLAEGPRKVDTNLNKLLKQKSRQEELIKNLELRLEKAKSYLEDIEKKIEKLDSEPQDSGVDIENSNVKTELHNEHVENDSHDSETGQLVIDTASDGSETQDPSLFGKG